MWHGVKAMRRQLDDENKNDKVCRPEKE